MKKFTALNRILALLTAVIICFSSLASLCGVSYAQSHPRAVNEGKSAEEIEAEDLEQFSQRTGYDYHQAGEGDYAPGELIVEISSSADTAASSLSGIENQFPVNVIKVISNEELEPEKGASASGLNSGGNLITSYLMETDEEDIISLCDELNKRADVFNAQPNFRYDICEKTEEVNLLEESQTNAFTEPPAFGTTNYTNNLKWWFDYCKISTAWNNYADSATGYGLGKGVKVAVIDTGCNTAHEDIIDNLWDDGNGHCGFYAYGGTLHNGTYISKNDSTNDTNGHGSHCCGTIAMSGKNTVGGIGTAPECSLIVLKADRNNGKGSFYDSELKSSLEKAAEFGADIVSMSLGGYNFSYSTYRTYQKVSSSCLIMCAAGNEAVDTTEKLHFPSAASCVMGVMATGNSSNKNKLATFSNYDTTGNFYKVAAPGTTIYSLDYSANNKYCNKNGTSMATPAAAGMVACYMSYIKNVKGWDWTAAQYQYRIEYVIGSNTYNSLSCGAYSQTYHPQAYNKGSQFKIMNLQALIGNIASSSSNPYSSTSAVSFSNSTIKDGVVNSTGLSADKLDTYAMRRVSLLYWSLDSTRKGISDYSDLTKLTGLNYLDLSGSSKFTSSTIGDVISKCPATIVHLNLNTSNKLGNLTCLANAKFPCLHYLNISSNNMTSLGAIAKFTSLKELNASSNSIVDISSLSGVKHIEKIELQNNLIQDPNPAFASDLCNYIDMSNNKLSDHTQLLNYKGAYHSSDFYSDTVTLKFDNNNMTGLTSSYAARIRLKINNQNTVNGENKVTTLNFTYSNQTAASSTVPMTSFSVSDKTVSREALCSGNLNSSAITGFTPYPANSNKYNYLYWTCSEPGYFAPDGTVLVTPEQITSCRTLTLTASAPEASGITTVKTIKLTITVPEIYNAYLTERVIKTGSKAAVLVATNQYTSRVYLKFTKSGSDPVTVYGIMPDDTIASGNAKINFFYVPDSVTGTAGSYSCLVYAADSQNNYVSAGNTDITGRTTYPYKSLGYLYVNDSVENSTDVLNVTYDAKINRYGQPAIYTTNSGTSSSSPAKPTGTYGLSTYTSQRKFTGGGAHFASSGAGYFGNDYTGYPNAQTGESSFFVTNSENSVVSSVESKITTLAPEVKAVELRNPNTLSDDGYAEYLVKTNTAATTLKAYKVQTQEDIGTDVNHIFTAFDNVPGKYAEYNASYSYKLWSIKVPLNSSNPEAVTFTAADPLGDGSVTMTPATGIEFSGSQYFYPGEKTYKYISDFLTFYPKDSEGNSLANCMKSVTYESSNSDYFTLSGSRLSYDVNKVLSELEGSSGSNKNTKITATLQNGKTASVYVYAYRPSASSLGYDKETSLLVPGGTVHYTVKTYGADTIYIRDVSDSDTPALMTLSKSDSDSFTEETDEKGNVYTIWSFERTFPEGESATMKTYVRCSYTFDNNFTSNSSSYSYNSVKSVAPGDYSAWYEQINRLSEDYLSKLADDYSFIGKESTYQKRLNDVTSVIDSAKLDYNENYQSSINNQTNRLKTAIDTLAGYDDYQSELSYYQITISRERFNPYVDDAYTAAYQTPADECSWLIAANNMQSERKRVTEVANYVCDYLKNDILRYETNVEGLSDENIPVKYGVQSYTAFKSMYLSTKSRVDEYYYHNKADAEADGNVLNQLWRSLHTHSFEEKPFAPLDKTAGYVLMYCSACGEYYSAAYESGNYSAKAPVDNPNQAPENCCTPAPAFNIFNNEGYDYGLHAGSLRLSESEEFTDFQNTTQGLRFTSSIKVPDGVNTLIGDEQGDAYITDIGYVYTQTKIIADNPAELVIGSDKVYSMSVRDKNAGIFDGTNWNGVTYHSEDNTLTFNLVINVKACNWEEDYCARAYVTYYYNGYTYTVYDGEYSSRSVEYLANEVVNSSSETEQTKNYCKTKILSNL